jgi:hypothetical protein
LLYQRIIEIRAAANQTGLPGPNNSGPDWQKIFSLRKYIYIGYNVLLK